MTPETTFFDIQVNGYAGVDFNRDGMTADQLRTACERLAADGVVGILATIITDDLDAMRRKLANLAMLRERDPLAREMIAGFHIEGPFINESDGYRGAHKQSAITPATPDAMQGLLDAAQGLTRLVTLAPERDTGLKTTRMLAQRGITVSAGHSNASLDDLRAAIDAGLSMFTHLGNGCPMMMHRHDNIIQRALQFADELTLCFIADGAHIPFPALSNYLRLANLEKTIVTTDCISPAGLGPGRYTLGYWEIEVGEDMVVWAPDKSHFVGSGITMKQSAANLREKLGLPENVVRQLICENPRRFLNRML